MLWGACPHSLPSPGFGPKAPPPPFKILFSDTFFSSRLCAWCRGCSQDKTARLVLGEPGSAGGQKTPWGSACRAICWPELSACQLVCLFLPLSAYTPIYLCVLLSPLPAHGSDCPRADPSDSLQSSQVVLCPLEGTGPSQVSLQCSSPP